MTKKYSKPKLRKYGELKSITFSREAKGDTQFSRDIQYLNGLEKK